MPGGPINKENGRVSTGDSSRLAAAAAATAAPGPNKRTPTFDSFSLSTRWEYDARDFQDLGLSAVSSFFVSSGADALKTL